MGGSHELLLAIVLVLTIALSGSTYAATLAQHGGSFLSRSDLARYRSHPRDAESLLEETPRCPAPSRNLSAVTAAKDLVYGTFNLSGTEVTLQLDLSTFNLSETIRYYSAFNASYKELKLKDMILEASGQTTAASIEKIKLEVQETREAISEMYDQIFHVPATSTKLEPRQVRPYWEKPTQPARPSPSPGPPVVDLEARIREAANVYARDLRMLPIVAAVQSLGLTTAVGLSFPANLIANPEIRLVLLLLLFWFLHPFLRIVALNLLLAERDRNSLQNLFIRLMLVWIRYILLLVRENMGRQNLGNPLYNWAGREARSAENHFWELVTLEREQVESLRRARQSRIPLGSTPYRNYENVIVVGPDGSVSLGSCWVENATFPPVFVVRLDNGREHAAGFRTPPQEYHTPAGSPPQSLADDESESGSSYGTAEELDKGGG